MTFIVEFAAAIMIATTAVCLGTKYIGNLGASQYKGMFDPEGNAGRAYMTAAKYLSLMASGIAGAIKLPAIINAIGKVIAAIAGTS